MSRCTAARAFKHLDVLQNALFKFLDVLQNARLKLLDLLHHALFKTPECTAKCTFKTSGCFANRTLKTFGCTVKRTFKTSVHGGAKTSHCPTCIFIRIFTLFSQITCHYLLCIYSVAQFINLSESLPEWPSVGDTVAKMY